MGLDKVLEAYNLTIEQEFKLRTDEKLINKASREQLQDLLLKALTELYRKDNQIKQLLKEKLEGN